jgi:hypothetical protein
VIAAVEYYEIFPSLHYVLDLASQISPGLVPEAVAERCLQEVLDHRAKTGNRGPLVDALLDVVAKQSLLVA